jgi:short-subunit dehydrogenase
LLCYKNQIVHLTYEKNVVITGTSTGVGFESSILFAQNGYKVFATMRDISKSNALKERITIENLDIDILQLDGTILLKAVKERFLL